MEVKKIPYANGVSLVTSNVEAIIFFTLETPEVDENGNIGEIHREQVACARINLEVAKQFSKDLSDQINKTENI